MALKQVIFIRNERYNSVTFAMQHLIVSIESQLEQLMTKVN